MCIVSLIVGPPQSVYCTVALAAGLYRTLSPSVLPSTVVIGIRIGAVYALQYFIETYT